MSFLYMRVSTYLLPGQSTQAAIVLRVNINIARVELGGHNASCRADKRCIGSYYQPKRHETILLQD